MRRWRDCRNVMHLAPGLFILPQRAYFGDSRYTVLGRQTWLSSNVRAASTCAVAKGQNDYYLMETSAAPCDV